MEPSPDAALDEELPLRRLGRLGSVSLAVRPGAPGPDDQDEDEREHEKDGHGDVHIAVSLALPPRREQWNYFDG
jgi:hypothetical protein